MTLSLLFESPLSSHHCARVLWVLAAAKAPGTEWSDLGFEEDPGRRGVFLLDGDGKQVGWVDYQTLCIPYPWTE